MNDVVKIPETPIASTAKTLAKVAKVKKPKAAAKKTAPLPPKGVVSRTAAKKPAALVTATFKVGQKVEFPDKGKKIKGVVFRVEKPIPTGQFIRVEYENSLHEKQYASRRPSQLKLAR